MADLCRGAIVAACNVIYMCVLLVATFRLGLFACLLD
jgi:hypothetical protein